MQSQQEVQRGGQPFYYYGMIIIPLNEFLSVAGTIAANLFCFQIPKFSKSHAWFLLIV
jgi:hypothetical protein